MRKPVEDNSFLKKLIRACGIIQIGSTALLIILALSMDFSTVTYNGTWVSTRSYIIMLLIQCSCSLFMLRSLSKSVLRRKAWMSWFISWGLGQVTIFSYGMQLNIRSTFSIVGLPMTIMTILLIFVTHSYIKRVRTVWDK